MSRRLRAWLREPGPGLATGERTFVGREPIELDRALAQHAGYARLLVELGCEVTKLAPLDTCSDACFVEDPALLLDGTLVLLRPGAESRRPEAAALGQELGSSFDVLELPCGRLDGGDVMRIGDTLWVGQSSRTDHAGLKALAHLVLESGLRVKALAVEGALHLKTGVTWLGGERVLANPAWVDTARLEGFELIEVDPDEPFGANTVRVPTASGDVLVRSASHPRTTARLEAAGLEVCVVPLDELEKAEAGATCLSLRDFD